MFTPTLDFYYTNHAYLRLTGKSWQDIGGQYAFNTFPESRKNMELVKKSFESALNGESTVFDALPYKIEQADGTFRDEYWQTSQEPYYDDQGNVALIIQRIENITAKIRLKEENTLISAELNHRVKNSLTVMRALVNISIRSAKSFESFKGDFTSRLDSMARTHQLLFEKASWEGLAIKSILRDELAMIAQDNTQNYKLSGPDIMLSHQFSKDFSLIVHELATNAVKYGCFSGSAGSLEVSWQICDGQLNVLWHEQGLTNLRQPIIEGFGSKMLGLIPGVGCVREFDQNSMTLSLKVQAEQALMVQTYTVNTDTSEERLAVI